MRPLEGLPTCDDVYEQVLSLPMYPDLTDEQVDEVVDAVTRVVVPCHDRPARRHVRRRRCADRRRGPRDALPDPRGTCRGLGVDVRLASSALPSALCERASRLDVEVVGRTGVLTDCSVVDEILGRGTDAVVLDSYAVGAEVVESFQALVGAVAIDDERHAPLGRPLWWCSTRTSTPILPPTPTSRRRRSGCWVRAGRSCDRRSSTGAGALLDGRARS